MSSGWSQTRYVAESGIEFMTLLPLPSERWGHKPSFTWCWGSFPGLVPTRQVLYPTGL